MKSAMRLLLFWIFFALGTCWGGLFQWDDLPPLPDREGFAGAYAGILREGEEQFLVVAGGANFPDRRPWEKDENGQGGLKVYYDEIYLLSLSEGGEWRKVDQKLPVPSAYGMSVDLADGRSLWVGGKNEDGVMDHVWEVGIQKGRLSLSERGTVPVPLAEGVAGLCNGGVVVAGGVTQNAKGEVQTHPQAWLLKLKDQKDEPTQFLWESLGWPQGARGRMYPVAGVRGGHFYLFGGRDFTDQSEGGTDRVLGLDFLSDCWALDVATKKWRRLAELPVGKSAAPGMAVPVGASSLVMLGGVSAPFLKEQIEARPELNGQGVEHPGFSGEILSYHAITDRWSSQGEMELGQRHVPVTTPVVFWPQNEGFKVILPTGEIQPGVRSPQVLVGTIEGDQLSFGFFNWVVVTIYLLGMVFIGYWFMKKNEASSTDDYFRGGQKIPFWVAGLSIFATMLSAITFMAVPATSYASNWNAFIGQWSMFVIVPLVVFFYLPFYRRLNITTAYQYLERRFNLACRVIGSLVFMVFHLGRIAIVLYLPALALSSVTSMDVFVAIVLIGLLCVIYTVMGGIEAVVWTDAIQAVVLIGGALCCFGFVVSQVDGGFGVIQSAMVEGGKGLTASWRFEDLSLSKGSSSGVVLLIAFLFANLPSYTAGQDVVQRYVTTSSQKEAARSLWMNIAMTFLGSAIFFGLGTALFVFYQDQPELMNPTLPAKDSILPFFIIQNLPAGMAGLIVAGIFAAAQSTISSSLNSVATAFVTDVYARILRPQSDDQDRLRIAKIVVVSLGVTGIGCSYFLAMSKADEVFMMFNRFIGFALGPLGGLFALGIFTSRPSGVAGLSALLVGVCSVIGAFLMNEMGIIDLLPLLYGAVGFLVTFLTGLVLGRFFRVNKGELRGLTIWTQEK